MARFLRTLLIPLFVLFAAVGAWVLPKFEAKVALSALSDALDTASRLVSRQEDARLEPNELVDVLAVIASGTRNNESDVFVDSKVEIVAGGNATVPLVKRQDDEGGLDENSCKTLCCSGTRCAANAVTKRSLEDAFDLALLATIDDSDFGNESHGLHKRAFPALNTEDPAAVGTYLTAREGRIGYGLMPTRAGGDISFTRTHRFQDFQSRPLIISTPSLTGCTVLTVVSRRAVYMGHFWQPLSFERHRGWDPPNLERNTLNLITGTRPLYLAEGTSLDPELFGEETITLENGETVTVQPYAAIMTPRYGVGEQQLYYPDKVREIAALIRERIGVDPVVYGYESMNTYPGGREGRLGAVLFEYEWDADGEGNGDWRLWYEYGHETGRGMGMFPQGANMPE